MSSGGWRAESASKHREQNAKPHRGITEEDWDRARGEICTRCGRETLRVQPNTSICPRCFRNLPFDFEEMLKQNGFDVQREGNTHHASLPSFGLGFSFYLGDKSLVVSCPSETKRKLNGLPSWAKEKRIPLRFSV